MKKYIITIIVTALVLAAIAGAIFLADKLFYDPNDENHVLTEAYSSSGIESLAIYIEVGYIDIIESSSASDFLVSTVGVDGDFYKVAVEGDVLSISSEEVKWYEREVYETVDSYGITVTVPSGFDGTIAAGTDAGKLSVTGVTVSELDVHTNAGDITLTDIHTSELEADTEVGDITVSGAYASKATLEADVGDVTFAEASRPETLLSSLSVTTNVGNIEVSLAGERQDYQITAATDRGECNVENGGDGIYINLSADVGDITVSF